MIRVLATNITSPLGANTEQNYQAMKSGCSALSQYDGWRGLPGVISAGLFSDGQSEAMKMDGLTRFESLAVHSVQEALSQTVLDVSSPRTLFVLTTTKANVEELCKDDTSGYSSPGQAARKVARQLGFTTDPIVVCNACISGVTGLLLAKRLLEAGSYDHVVVCGADCQSEFTISGFQSFKALSPFACRPFDIERLGLNLGEAASTMVLSRESADGAAPSASYWVLREGCLNNDAYHVSAPSPQGEGVYRGLQTMLSHVSTDELGMVCVHGTATMFNDQMESKAIEQAGLSQLPASALKGYVGHTLGASGVLETVITMRALEEGVILPTQGFEELGVSGKVNICNTLQTTDKQSFLKIISGFGGCNGALLLQRVVHDDARPDSCADSRQAEAPVCHTTHTVRLTRDALYVDGEKLPTHATGKALLTEIYKERIGGYTKYYKMDALGRLAFVASELLIKAEGDESKKSDRAVVLFNGTSSIVADRKFLTTILDKDNYFPSPADFLYTLPNIVTGEIAIKHQYKAETSLYILPRQDDELMRKVALTSFDDPTLQSMITGWIDCPDEDDFVAELMIVERENK